MVQPINNGIYTREDLWGLAAWDPTLVWYAKAMGAMFQLPISNASSWRYQAAIHGYDGTMPQLQALAQPGETLPDDADTYWKRCQHHGWFFLPWHRGYLGYFERIVRKTIVGLGGPAEWALPYWNYSDTGQNADVARLVRPEFLATQLPDGSANALFQGVVRGRYQLADTPKGQAADFGIGPKDVRLKCLTYNHFYDSASASSFGGGQTAFSHGEGGVDVSGGVEKTPHDNVHGDLGGWMGSFETAGLDPLFWLHHANIDRLWAVWAADPGHAEPPDASWLDPTGSGFPYQFHDENGVSQVVKPSDVLDTAASVFTYRYQDTSVPAQVAAFAARLPAAITTPPAAVAAPSPPLQAPQLAGASDTNIDLSPAQVSVDLPIQAQAPTVDLAAGTGARRIYLNVESVIGGGQLDTRYVYLNPPNTQTPDEEPELYAGSLPMFGVAEMSRSVAANGGNGKNFVLNVTDVVAHLQQTGRWDGQLVRVYIVAKNPPASDTTLTAGRISLYYR